MQAFHIDLSHLQDTTGIEIRFGSDVFELWQHPRAWLEVDYRSSGAADCRHSV